MTVLRSDSPDQLTWLCVSAIILYATCMRDVELWSMVTQCIVVAASPVYVESDLLIPTIHERTSDFDT